MPGGPKTGSQARTQRKTNTRDKLLTILRKYAYVFAWRKTDRLQHQTKKRGQTLDRNRAINVEVAKLVDSGILREATFADLDSKFSYGKEKCRKLEDMHRILRYQQGIP
uniref:Uncharacterized protein n=1 Tax=Lactuca sativa TaxID=4236 RepID=A0A9R1V023_LACSA|nr:hypothetical protein LSAT_V11C700351180 [Lactuca sativa]